MNFKWNDVSKYFLIALEIVIIIVLTKIFVSVSGMVIERIFKKHDKNKDEKSPWADLFKSVVKYAAWILAVIFCLEAAGIDFGSMYLVFNNKNDETLKFVGIAVKIIIIIIAMKLSIKVLCSVTEAFFEKQKGTRFPLSDRKADTLSGLFKTIIKYVLFFIAALMSFDAAGINIGTFIAVTSVVGVAVGFGAQSLVKDIISGFFILFEDQFAVGDCVKIGDVTGIVETFGIRATKIRDFSGCLYIIPNGSIDKVTNKSRGNMSTSVEIDVDYNEDIDKAIRVVKDVCSEMEKDCDFVITGPSDIGISKINGEAVTIKVSVQTLPLKQWNAESEFRKRIKYAFDRNHIKMGCPQKILISK